MKRHKIKRQQQQKKHHKIKSQQQQKSQQQKKKVGTNWKWIRLSKKILTGLLTTSMYVIKVVSNIFLCSNLLVIALTQEHIMALRAASLIFAFTNKLKILVGFHLESLVAYHSSNLILAL